MKWFGLSFCLLFALFSVHTSAYPRVRRQAELQDNADLTPLSDDSNNEDLSERDKRTLEAATQSKYGVKNAILGLIFGSSGTQKSISISGKKSTKPRVKVTTTTEEIPVFDRNKVSLQFPGELFGSSLSLLLKSTKIVGSVIENSAQRYQSFLRLFSPLFRGQFAIKGLDPITTTTEKPLKKSASSSSEIETLASSETTTVLSFNLIR